MGFGRESFVRLGVRKEKRKRGGMVRVLFRLTPSESATMCLEKLDGKPSCPFGVQVGGPHGRVETDALAPSPWSVCKKSSKGGYNTSPWSTPAGRGPKSQRQPVPAWPWHWQRIGRGNTHADATNVMMGSRPEHWAPMREVVQPAAGQERV